MAMIFHQYDLGPSSRYVGGGIYSGGIGRAKELLKNFKAEPGDFKFVYGQMGGYF